MLVCTLHFLHNISGIGQRYNRCVIVSVDVLQIMHLPDRRESYWGTVLYFATRFSI